MSTAAIQRIALSPAHLIEAAAQEIVRRHRAELPDLRNVVILIPDLHAAPHVARALRSAVDLPVLLLPRILTLRQWAGEIALNTPVLPRAVRETVLYGALAGHGSLGEADRWAVAAELLSLFDELTRHTVALPQSPVEFAHQLEKAYRARKNRSLEFEATLVHELWRLMARDSNRALDAEAAYQLRLGQIAASAHVPLYSVGVHRLASSEVQFLEGYALRAPVVVIEPTQDADDAVTAMIAAAWPRVGSTSSLLARAQELRRAYPESAFTRRVTVLGASSAEQEARAVDIQVRDWLLAGKQRIAVVALDRVTARRARALLERAQVLVRDEAGWPMATTSAATVLSRWLDVASGDAYHRDLLDLMKSPFAFHDWPRDARQQAVWRLERAIRVANITAGIGNFIALAEQHNDAEARQLLVRIQRGISTLGGTSRARHPIARWLQVLRESLTEIGVMDGLAADSAGAQIQELLEKLGEDLAHDTLAIPFTEWRRWLARQMEAASFIEHTVESPVVFTHLAATPLRAFDAVLVLGCDARHLSGVNDATMFFNQSVRLQLGLPTRQDEVHETQTLLAALIVSTPTLLFTWQKLSGGEANLIAPPMARLLALHQCAYGAALEATRLEGLIAQTELRCADELPPAPLQLPPAPPAAKVLLSDAISASGYNTLVACPYQYHARYLLRLAQLDDVQELIEKSDYGLHVHDVLSKFHADHAMISHLPHDVAIAELEQLSDAAFAQAVSQNYLARGWLLRWKALIPAYVDWQCAREAEGWRWHVGEAARRIVIETPGGQSLTLLGRIDRVDVGADNRVAVVDYKTRNAAKLAEVLKMPGEDVQLPVYALLWGGPVAAALFLSIERDGVKAVPIEDEITQLAESTRQRLGTLYDAMSTGQPLAAQGAPQVCQYCEMHGLCRRAHW